MEGIEVEEIVAIVQSSSLYEVISVEEQGTWEEKSILQIADSKKAPLGRFFTLVGRAGFEPATNWLKVNCSTNWANDPVVGDDGIEPPTPSL